MRILVTGAAGFIGSHVVERFLDRGDEVVAIDNLDPVYDPQCKRRNLEAIAGGRRAHAFTFIQGDVRDVELVERLCRERRFDTIVHLAALANVRASIGAAKRYFDVNLHGTITLLDAARDAEIGNFVFASTSSVYGATTHFPLTETAACDRPLAPYPASKRACEMLGFTYHNLFDLNFTALRFFTVYGPRNRPDMMAYRLLDSITRGVEVPLYNAGNLCRDWTYVADIAAGVVAAADRRLGYEVINLGRGEPIALREMVRLLEECSRGRARLRPTAQPPTEVSQTYAAIGKARALLDYTPTTSIREGLHALWQWYNAHAHPARDRSAEPSTSP